MLLRRIGYGLPGDAEVTLEQVLIAFQRRYRPARFDGILDAETEDRLRAVAANVLERQAVRAHLERARRPGGR